MRQSSQETGVWRNCYAKTGDENKSRMNETESGNGAALRRWSTRSDNFTSPAIGRPAPGAAGILGDHRLECEQHTGTWVRQCRTWLAVTLGRGLVSKPRASPTPRPPASLSSPKSHVSSIWRNRLQLNSAWVHCDAGESRAALQAKAAAVSTICPYVSGSAYPREGMKSPVSWTTGAVTFSG